MAAGLCGCDSGFLAEADEVSNRFDPEFLHECCALDPDADYTLCLRLLRKKTLITSSINSEVKANTIDNEVKDTVTCTGGGVFCTRIKSTRDRVPNRPCCLHQTTGGLA